MAAVFRKMLKRGNPPDAWKELLAAAAEPAVERLLARSGRRRAISGCDEPLQSLVHCRAAVQADEVVGRPNPIGLGLDAVE